MRNKKRMHKHIHQKHRESSRDDRPVSDLMLISPIEDLGLSPEICNTLKSYCDTLRTVEDLLTRFYYMVELFNVPGIGGQDIAEISDCVYRHFEYIEWKYAPVDDGFPRCVPAVDGLPIWCDPDDWSLLA